MDSWSTINDRILRYIFGRNYVLLQIFHTIKKLKIKHYYHFEHACLCLRERSGKYKFQTIVDHESLY